jgi:hypothetical protein
MNAQRQGPNAMHFKFNRTAQLVNSKLLNKLQHETTMTRSTRGHTTSVLYFTLVSTVQILLTVIKPLITGKD